MRQQSRTVASIPQGSEPIAGQRHLPLVDLLIDTRAELLELVVRSGLKVLETMLEENRTAVCGSRYAHLAERATAVLLSIGSHPAQRDTPPPAWTNQTPILLVLAAARRLVRFSGIARAVLARPSRRAGTRISKAPTGATRQGTTLK